MRSILVSSTLCALIALPQLVSAAPRTIKGKLGGEESFSGYRVIGLDNAGETIGIKGFAAGSRFAIRAGRKKAFSLSLTKDGSYLGSVVLAIKNGRRILPFSRAVASGLCSDGNAVAVMGGRFGRGAGAFNTGIIDIETDDGFASVRRRIPKKLLNVRNSADVDTSCVPVGARGKQGYDVATTSVLRRGAVAAADLDGDGIDDLDDSDIDGDGVPNLFDQDANGDGILDLYDALGAESGDDEGDDDDDEGDEGDGEDDEEEFLYFFSNNAEFLENSFNFNNSGVTDEQVDTQFQSSVSLAIKIGGAGEKKVELDCNGNTYCSSGGSGLTANFGACPDGSQFPAGFDPDGDGKGDVVNDDEAIDLVSCNPFGALFLKPNTSQININPGDVLIQEITEANGSVTLRPLTLDFVMNTHPTPVQIVTGVGTTNFDYPITAGEPGTSGNCIQYSQSNPFVEITVNRPTRKGLTASGEAEKVTMGRLIYQLSAMPQDGTPTGSIACSFAAYSESDASLELNEGTILNEDFGVVDTSGDRDFDSNADNTLTFRIDLSQCPELGGVSGTKQMSVKARNSKNDNAQVSFCMQGV